MEKADDLPRNEWQLARVLETTKDKDGLVRRVNLCLGHWSLGRDNRCFSKM